MPASVNLKSLRETLVDSHISAIAIAVLIFQALDVFVRGLLDVLPAVFYFLTAAIAIRGMPYVSHRLTDQFGLLPSLFYLCDAVLNLAAAWLLSRWVYQVGLFAVLSRYRPTLARKNNV